MISIATCLLVVTGVLSFAIRCHRKDKKALKASTLSSVEGTCEVQSKLTPWLTYNALAAAIVASVLVAVEVAPFWLAILCGAIYAALRAFQSKLLTVLGKRTAPTRYLQALKTPLIAQARYALYFSEPRLLTPFQVTMWLDPLLSLQEPFVILLKERKHLKHFPKSDLYEVLIVSELPATFPFLPPRTEVVFYVNNSMVNLNVIKANPDVAHVQLLHGDSDKPPSFNPMSAAYDHLFVAGEMAIDRYARNGVTIPREKFRIVGRPQLSLPEPSTDEARRKTVVYMTTWAGMFEDSNFCSLPQAHEILRNTFSAGQDLDVVFKPHPVSYRDPSWPKVQANIDKVSQSLPNGITFRMAAHDEDPLSLYTQADVLITDISSTVIDYLYTGKPYIVTNPREYSPEFLEAFPSVDGGHLIAPDGQDIANALTDCLGKDSLKAKRLKLRNYAFGDYGKPQGQAFRQACRALLT